MKSRGTSIWLLTNAVVSFRALVIIRSAKDWSFTVHTVTSSYVLPCGLYRSLNLHIEIVLTSFTLFNVLSGSENIFHDDSK